MPIYQKLAVLTDNGIRNYHDRAYYYDYKGRIIQQVEKISPTEILRTTSKYDLAGNLLAQRESYTQGNATSVLNRTFEYDTRNRMTKETAQYNNGELAVVNHTYDNLGQLTGTTYGTGSHAIHETMEYNLQGWLTRKNSELFEMKLRYYDPEPYYGGDVYYTGNISEWWWLHKNVNGRFDADNNTYIFHYDDLARLNDSRLTYNESEDVANEFTERGITYDKNSNILTLNRSSLTSEDARSFNFSYIGNQRNKETNGNTTYSYDANGNITTEGVNGLQISYNFLNLPTQIFCWGDYPDYYAYLADGTKILHEYSDGKQDRYIGSLVYEYESAPTMAFGGGRIIGTGDGSEVHYFLTDHLGSTRVVAKVTPTGRIDLDRKDYYPFGKAWTQSGMPASGNKYTFSGKERNDITIDDGVTTPLHDFGARFYDPDGVTWMQQDPLMHKYYPIGQYVYCAGNPVNRIDPDGKIVIPIGSKEYVDHFYSNIKYMQSKGTAGGYNILHKSDNIYFVKEGESKIKVSNTGVNTIYWNPDIALLTTNNKILSPATILAHEFEHGVDAETDIDQYITNNNSTDEQYGDKNEKNVITNEEQDISKRHGEIEEGEVTRTDHKGFHVQVQYTDPKEIEKFIQNYNRHNNENQ